MNWKIRFAVMIVGIACLFLGINNAQALTPEQVIALKNAGVSDQTIQLMIRQEQDAAQGNPADFSGRKEIKDRDGKTVIIYSTGRPTGNNQTREEKQTERAWEMLNNIIIDTRKSK
jgi:hypothetical protein